jgi:hypothetical protein
MSMRALALRASANWHNIDARPIDPRSIDPKPWAGANQRQHSERVELPPAVDAPREIYATPTSKEISWYADGPEGTRPLVLLHSVNAAPSVFEMKPLFEHYRAERRVYAPDLPGFGFSDRSDRPTRRNSTPRPSPPSWPTWSRSRRTSSPSRSVPSSPPAPASRLRALQHPGAALAHRLQQAPAALGQA